MRVLFDTSVLIASAFTGHPKHQICLAYLQQVQSGELTGLLATHTLAEIYSVLTRMPKTNVSPKLAEQFIQENLKPFVMVELSTDDYQAAIRMMVSLNLPGGGIYDAVIAQAAISAKADQLLTLNEKHFNRLGQEVSGIIRSLY